MRNSSLVKRLRAENVSGLKCITEARGPGICLGGRRALQAAAKVDRQGRLERLQASMLTSVTRKRVKIPFAENPRFPGQGSSAQGESEPKARPKGVVDGKLVNIPAPRFRRLSGGVTQDARPPRVTDVPGPTRRLARGNKTRAARLRGRGKAAFGPTNWLRHDCREKLRSAMSGGCPYRKPPQVDWMRNPRRSR